VFDGSPATPSATSTIKISLPPEPPLVLAALQRLVQERNPQLVQRIDSVAVKYVTDRAFWYAISSAWKTGNPASCGTGSGFATLNGHWYVVDLHGKFVDLGRSVPGGATTYVSVMVDLVTAADLPASKGGSFIDVPVGADGQPLCWSLLPG
jgi:hypothetical protein